MGVVPPHAKRLCAHRFTAEISERAGGCRSGAAGCGSDFGAVVPNPTTVAAIEAARRGEVVELGTPAEAIAELNRDD